MSDNTTPMPHPAPTASDIGTPTATPDQPPASGAWHALPVDAAVDALGASHEGLSDADAGRLLAEHGRDEIRRREGPSAVAVLVRQLTSPLIYALLVSALVALALGELAGGAVVLAVVVLNALIGFVQEYRAGKASRRWPRSSPSPRRAAASMTTSSRRSPSPCRRTSARRSSSSSRSSPFPIHDGDPLLPIQPVQILWINLVATVSLALPLAFEAMEPGLRHRNRTVYGGIATLLALQAGFVHLPFMRALFSTASLSAAEWLLAAGAGALTVPVVAAGKAWRAAAPTDHALVRHGR